MIFSELYSVYYNTVAKILGRLVEGDITEKEIARIVSENAFDESGLTILPALKSGRWQLMHQDLTTPIKHKPSMPLTALEKRWLKSISLDPRIRLFGVSFDGLDDVEPLFTNDDYYVYDKYGDGDPFEDPEYIRRFRIILSAIKQKRQIKFDMINRSGRQMYIRCQPMRLEYSEKDDKFRLVTGGCRFITTVNLSRMLNCGFYYGDSVIERVERPAKTETLTIKIYDERNAPERVMLHFAHFEKQAERIDNRSYLLRVKYSLDDEPELVIRVLSFGPTVEVLEPESFRNLIIEKLKKQQKIGIK